MKHSKIIDISAEQNRLQIEEDSKQLSFFGISCLDDCFVGIKKNDLIVCGAPSGTGKTEILTNIACNNASKGKKVYFFALESYPREIERRIAYKIASNKFFEDENRPKIRISFMAYENNMVDKAFKPYAIFGETEAETLYRENLKICLRGKNGYNVNHFVEEFSELNLLADLILVDHINYFDQIGKMSEYENLTYAAKKINEMVNIHSVPVIVAAQLNRNWTKDKPIVPDLDSIHGTSNIAKEATKVFFITKNKSENQPRANYLSPTYIHAAKNRSNGDTNKYVLEVNFDFRNNSYEQNYFIGELSYDRTSINKYLQFENKPCWAKSAQ